MGVIRQTDRQIDGHRDLETESAQWADSVISENLAYVTYIYGVGTNTKCRKKIKKFQLCLLRCFGLKTFAPILKGQNKSCCKTSKALQTTLIKKGIFCKIFEVVLKKT